jgi:RNA polymerase sigma factor (sigma-70 family)
LVVRARQGDQKAFGELVDRYRDMVYGLGYHLTGDFETARDLAQEAFVQAFVKLNQLREPGKFAGWLRKIATNVHRAQRRRRQVRTVALEAATGAADAPPPSETNIVVREALDRLRAPERLALTLAYVNGYSQAEIAGFLGVRTETVKTRLARARQHLRTEVVAMVEHEFERHALPPEFQEDVVRGVEGLVSRFTDALPPDPEALCARLKEDSRAAWQELLAQMPGPYGRPLKEQGQAPRARIGDLPAEVRQLARRAAYLHWTWSVLHEAVEKPPWLKDVDSLWIDFYEVGGSLYARFKDVPGPLGGTISSMSLGPEEGNPRGEPPSAAEVDRVLAECDTPELSDLVARLRALVPRDPGSLAGALYTRMQRLLRQVLEQLPPALRVPDPVGRPSRGPEGLASARRLSTEDLPSDLRSFIEQLTPELQETLLVGPRAAQLEAAALARSISVKDLPVELRDLVRQAVHLHRGSHILQAIEHPPPWLLLFPDSNLEFGRYSHIDGEYVIIAGGTSRGDQSDQTSIS